MTFLVLAFVAGILTVLAPCILPLLPVVIGASEPGERGVSRRALIVTGTLALSVVIFTLLLKASTFLIAIPTTFWTSFSGGVLVLLGLTFLFPDVWGRVPGVSRLAQSSNKAVGGGYQKNSVGGDVVMGLALGPVFSTCSPTYLYIVATVLPASFLVGLSYLFAFVLGLTLALLLIAYFGQQFINAVLKRFATANRIKQVLGGLLVLVGASIMFGFDKQFETAILDSGYGATIQFEEGWISRLAPKLDTDPATSPAPVTIVPTALKNTFPHTDWTNVDDRLALAVSGGPPKDGIPAIDTPTFMPIDSFTRSGDIEAVVVEIGDTVRVYPYHILTWHEIVNDTVAGVPVAVTFCPLCGSAIVFERTIGGTETTFGVSGSLIDSNMIMYDRQTESLWQQSTGAALAGTHYGQVLKLVPFHRLTMAEVATRYPNAQVLSEDTGYRRDYARNPYAGYDTSDETFFSISELDGRYHPKTLFVVFREVDGVVVLPWEAVRTGSLTTITTASGVYTVTVTDGVVAIANTQTDELVPYYFEMWFSIVAQHDNNAIQIINSEATE